MYTAGNRNRRNMEIKKVYIIPLVMSATEITLHTFIKNFKHLNIKPPIHQSIQKAIVLKTCSIVRSSLNSTTIQ